MEKEILAGIKSIQNGVLELQKLLQSPAALFAVRSTGSCNQASCNVEQRSPSKE